MSIDLCPNVNFINGQNGSGKSAVLAAVQICLGASAAKTHRAKGLANLIRNGSDATHAKVRVQMRNMGADAFQHERYGDYITVERIIERSGGSQYRLLDENDKVKSKAKNDLDAMLDLFNIQVDNPVAVLDQEEAKSFLQGKAEAKYRFFSKATELERIDRTYSNIGEAIEDFKVSEKAATKALRPALELKERMEKEWEECRALERLEDQVTEHNMNRVWAILQLMEEKNEEKKAEAEKSRADVDNFRAKLDKVREKVEATEGGGDDERAEMEKKLEMLVKEADGAADHVRVKNEEVKQLRKPIHRLEQDRKHREKELKNREKDLKDAKKKLKDARDAITERRGAGNEKAANVELLKKKEAEIEKSNEDMKSIVADRQEALSEYNVAKEKTGETSERLKSIKSRFDDAATTVNQLKKDKGSNLASWGRYAGAFLNAINQAKRKNQIRGNVYGPIGAHIKVKAGKEKWGKIAEVAIGNMPLCQFVCDNQADLAVLRQLRKTTGCGDGDLSFSFQRPGPRYRTQPFPSEIRGIEVCINVLQIENDLIYNYLCDTARAERKCLAATKEESEEKLIVRNGHKYMCRASDIQECYFYPNGDYWAVKNGGISIRSNDGPMKGRLGVNKEQMIANAISFAKGIEAELNEGRREHKKVNDEAASLKSEWNDLSKALTKVQRKIKQLEDDVEELTSTINATDDDEDDTTQEQLAVEECEGQVKTLTEEINDFNIRIDEAAPKVSEAEKDLEEIKARNAKIQDDIDSHTTKLQEIMKNTQKLKSKFEKSKEIMAMKEANAAEARKIFEDSDAETVELGRNTRKLIWVTQKKQEKAKARQSEEARKRKDEDNANSDSEDMNKDDEEDEDEEEREPTEEELEAIKPPSINHSPSYFEARVKKAQEQLEKEREKRKISDIDPAVVYEKMQRARKAAMKKKLAIDGIKQNIEMLTTDMHERRRKWKALRKHIAHLTNVSFDQLLGRKGQAGCLNFDHRDKTLDLIVQKDADQASQTSDVKLLSGGERSYVTLCLLLALGENLETPFRVMDEFDVFLDAVSRKVALTNLTDAAKALHHRQFIFITPQDLSTLHPGPELKIIKMRPPERGQQTLVTG